MVCVERVPACRETADLSVCPGDAISRTDRQSAPEVRTARMCRLMSIPFAYVWGESREAIVQRVGSGVPVGHTESGVSKPETEVNA